MNDLIHLISWDREEPKWVLKEEFSSGDFQYLFDFNRDILTFDDPTVLTMVQMFIAFNQRSIEFTIGVPGLAISKNDPSRAYRASEFRFSRPIEFNADDFENDPWSDERHDKEIQEAEWLSQLEKFARRLILFQGNAFLASEALADIDEQERLFLLVEDFMNKKKIEMERLRKRVAWQRRMLGLNHEGRQRQRRSIPDELVRLIIDRDEICQGCGSDEDLQLDHVIPISEGGNDSEGNLRLLCGACNRRRGNLGNV